MNQVDGEMAIMGFTAIAEDVVHCVVWRTQYTHDGVNVPVVALIAAPILTLPAK